MTRKIRHWPAAILSVCAVYVLFALAAVSLYLSTGRPVWVNVFFRYPGALFLLVCAMAEAGFACSVWRRFDSSEPLAKAWLLLTLAGAFRVAGVLFVHVLAVPIQLNPIYVLGFWSGELASQLSRFGALLGGPALFFVMALGLAAAVLVFRQLNMIRRLKRIDYLLVALIGAYGVYQIYDMTRWLQERETVSIEWLTKWATDPLLAALLLEALLLRRVVAQMKGALIARCWSAYAVGILLTSLGNITLWATPYGYLSEPWASLSWIIWFPAAAFFAAAPAWQHQTLQIALGPNRQISIYSTHKLQVLP
jgi:hypothetical protein